MSDLDISPHGPTRVSLTRVRSPDEPVELILLIRIHIMNNDHVNDYTNNGLSIYFAFDPLPTPPRFEHLVILTGSHFALL